MSRVGKQVRFRSRKGDQRLVKAAARWRAGAGVSVAESDSSVADCGSGLRHRLEHSVREVTREDAGLSLEWRARARRENWVSWHLRISETESRGVDFRRLSRLADGSHV